MELRLKMCIISFKVPKSLINLQSSMSAWIIMCELCDDTKPNEFTNNSAWNDQETFIKNLYDFSSLGEHFSTVAAIDFLAILRVNNINKTERSK